MFQFFISLGLFAIGLWFFLAVVLPLLVLAGGTAGAFLIFLISLPFIFLGWVLNGINELAISLEKLNPVPRLQQNEFVKRYIPRWLVSPLFLVVYIFSVAAIVLVFVLIVGNF